MDSIHDSVDLPEHNIGDWLYFPDMGAYTTSCTSDFNGMPPVKQTYVCMKRTWYVVGIVHTYNHASIHQWSICQPIASLLYYIRQSFVLCITVYCFFPSERICFNHIQHVESNYNRVFLVFRYKLPK